MPQFGDKVHPDPVPDPIYARQVVRTERGKGLDDDTIAIIFDAQPRSFPGFARWTAGRPDRAEMSEYRERLFDPRCGSFHLADVALDEAGWPIVTWLQRCRTDSTVRLEEALDRLADAGGRS